MLSEFITFVVIWVVLNGIVWKRRTDTKSKYAWSILITVVMTMIVALIGYLQHAMNEAFEGR